MDFLDRVGLRHPLIQAGMGGGVAGAELAGAVSAAGALGTLGLLPASHLAGQLADARERADGAPVAANLLVPFTRAAHVRACVDGRATLVVFHGGIGHRWYGTLQSAGVLVFCTIGDLRQAREALDAGADGLVVQGGEAGGHLMGDEPLDVLLPLVRELGRFPILAAGGVADARDVARVRAAGADAAVAGTRFLMTDESRAHPAYKQRLTAARRTVRTMLFGLGWPLAHRVVPNAATDRWAGPDGEVPAALRQLERASAPLARVLPLRASNAITARQRAGIPLFGPGLPVVGMPASSVEHTALYAGETVSRIEDVLPAADVVALLTSPGSNAS